MKQDIDTATATGAAKRSRMAEVRAWLTRAWAWLRDPGDEQIVDWQSTLLSRRKLTHPNEVTKLREPVRPTTRATWYR